MRQDALTYYQDKLARFPDASARVFERPGFAAADAERVHITGVCGTAMASLAGLLVAAGYRVSGSDKGCYPPMSVLIDELGLDFYEGYASENLAEKDVVVIGNAIHPDNPEAAHARLHGLRQLSVAEALQKFFMTGKRSLVVAGTHGKTTTTGILTHVFTATGQDPTYLVGGIMQGSERSFRFGRGAHFLIEGDEYDTAYFDKCPKFLHYRPASAVVTSVEFDHADIFHDPEDYARAFRFFVREVPADGHLFVYGDDPAVLKVASEAVARTTRYGLGPGNDLTARDVTVDAGGQRFTLVKNGEALGELQVPMSGEHNLLNTLAVCGISLAEGLGFDALGEALASFPGMKRRQEVRGIAGDVVVIDDFAHHPTAVRETILAIRAAYPDRRLVAVFEPRSNTSRRKLFEDDYGRAFDGADLAYIASSLFLHSDTAGSSIDGEKVAARIRERGTPAHFGGTADDLLETLAGEAKAGDVVLVMSNGDFGNLHGRLLERLGQRGHEDRLRRR